MEQRVSRRTCLVAHLLASSQVPIIAIEGSSQTSYVDRISGRLKTLEYFPDITQDMSARANQIDAALTNNVQNWLDHVRQYAKQLVNMKDSQLLLPSSKSILIDMQTQAQNALFGTDKEQE